MAPSWGAVAYGVALSVLLAVIAVRLLLHERSSSVLAIAGGAAGLAPLLWDLILRHTGGRFFTDAPGLVFPVSYEDTGSGVFATALSALAPGFGPMGASSGRRLASTAAVCGLAA